MTINTPANDIAEYDKARQALGDISVGAAYSQYHDPQSFALNVVGELASDLPMVSRLFPRLNRHYDFLGDLLCCECGFKPGKVLFDVDRHAPAFVQSPSEYFL